MRYRFVICLLLCYCTCVPAQNPHTAAELEMERIAHEKTAMLVLGGWAVGNIGLGLLLRAGNEGEHRRFHEMNALWNVVNLGIAGIGYFTVTGADPSDLGAFGSFEENIALQRILLFNAGLDFGYLLGGAYLIERARRSGVNHDLLRGYGKSVMLQGGFLLVFDLVNYFIARGRDVAYGPLLGVSGEGMGLTLWF